MIPPKNLIIGGLLIVLLGTIAFSYYLISCEDDSCFIFDWQRTRATRNFEECVLRGYPVLESYPRQCKADGRIFIEVVDERQGTDKKPSPAVGKCVVGGCSGELCVDASLGGVASVCIYREEYACYKSAKCERQQDGRCGWTQTDELASCIASKRSQNE